MTGERDDNEPDEQPERRLSLREIAERGLNNEGDRPRKSNHVVDGFLGDDRVLTPDSDGKIYYDDDESPRFRSERHAAESLQDEKEAADENQHTANVQYLKDNEEQWKQNQQSASTISTEDERGQLQEYHRQYAQLQLDAAKQTALEQKGAAEIAALRAAGQEAAAQIIAEKIVAGRAPLQEKYKELTQIGQQWGQYQKTKDTKREQRELLRLAPELADEGTRESFLSWLQKEHAIPRRDAEAERNPQVVGRYFKEFRKHEGEMYERLARRKVASEVARPSRGPGSSSTSSDARKALREGGSPDDALSYWALRRAERKYNLT